MDTSVECLYMEFSALLLQVKMQQTPKFSNESNRSDKGRMNPAA
jgi:hypothetical protein